MKRILLLLFLALPSTVLGAQKADLVLVKKSESKLFLVSDDKPFREYDVVFGAEPIGHKQQEGDERTPEGKYTLDYKKEDSAFYKAIHISYPNEQDVKHAQAKGISPGGQIMIHGQRNGLGLLAFLAQRFNWTDGCIAVTNSEMEEIWQAVDAGTPIEILP